MKTLGHDKLNPTDGICQLFASKYNAKNPTNEANYDNKNPYHNVVPFELIPFQDHVENTGEHKAQASTSKATYQAHE